MSLKDYVKLYRRELYGSPVHVFCHDENHELDVIYSFDLFIRDVFKGCFDVFEIREISYFFPLNMYYFEMSFVSEVIV